MIKGKWIIIAVLLIAVVMGIATWPLLRIRRRHEIHKTTTMLNAIQSACDQYRARHGQFPANLGFLSASAPLEFLDAWRRPIQYTCPGVRNKARFDLWSLGPNPDDPADDIWN